MAADTAPILELHHDGQVNRRCRRRPPRSPPALQIRRRLAHKAGASRPRKSNNAQRRNRLHCPHADRPRLSRRLQRHAKPGARRPRYRKCDKPRRHRPCGGRGRRFGRCRSTRRTGLQHRSPGSFARRSARQRRRHVGGSAMRLRPHGNRHRGQTDHQRRYADHRRRRPGVRSPLPRPTPPTVRAGRIRTLWPASPASTWP